MSKNAPTLADAVLRESFRPNGKSFIPAYYRSLIAQARKFVMDESMSAFLAELAHRPFHKAVGVGERNDKATAVGEHLRHSARLPHALTWVEYSGIAFKKYVLDNWPETMPAQLNYGLPTIEDTVPHVGWLLEQHPKVETCFRATLFVDSGPNEHRGPCVLPFALSWCSDEIPIAWPHLVIDYQGTPPSARIMGITGYNSKQVVYSPLPVLANPDLSLENLTPIMDEFTGEGRRIFAFLATIGDLPITLADVRPSKGYVAKGTYRRFLEHKIIRLTVPLVEYRTAARQVLALARRRAHQVRGHWRVIAWQAQKPCQRDTHVWDAANNCACGAFRTWIAEHQRGDASRGFVTHDYEVTHGEQ